MFWLALWCISSRFDFWLKLGRFGLRLDVLAQAWMFLLSLGHLARAWTFWLALKKSNFSIIQTFYDFFRERQLPLLVQGCDSDRYTYRLQTQCLYVYLLATFCNPIFAIPECSEERQWNPLWLSDPSPTVSSLFKSHSSIFRFMPEREESRLKIFLGKQRHPRPHYSLAFPIATFCRVTYIQQWESVGRSYNVNGYKGHPDKTTKLFCPNCIIAVYFTSS